MAANMSKRESKCGPLTLCFILLVLLSVCLSFASTSTSTTAPPATTDASSAAASPTAPPTNPTTTTTTTTTTAAPVQPQIDASLLIGQCPCDVTGNACDINCCCDGDCSDADNLAFTQCLPYSQPVNEQVCFQKELFLFENSDQVQSDTQGDLFCIYSVDSADINMYSQPDLIRTLETFQDYQQEFPSFSALPQPLSADVINASFYKSGDPIYTVFETEAIGMLGLPRPLTSVECVDDSPAAYLSDESYSCVRRVNNLVSACTTSPSLNAHMFFSRFAIVSSPQLFQELNMTLNGTDGAFSLYNSSYSLPVTLNNQSGDPIQCLNTATGVVAPCGYTTLPFPTLVAGFCQDMLSQVDLTVVTSGSSGITQVLARFVLFNSPASASPVSFTQRYSITFISSSASDSVQRSGNPGYVVGQPLLVGTLNQTTNQIELNADRTKYLTMPRSSANGQCVTGNTDRISVVFGQDMLSGCSLRLTAANVTDYCRQMQELIVQTLELDSVPQIANNIYLDNNRSVGLYGNSEASSIEDWAEVLYKNRPLPSDPISQTSSCDLTLGLQMQVLYANTGALVDPQPKVIALVFVYDDPTTVQVKASGSGQVDQAVTITSSVTFVDVSKPSMGYDPQPPIYLPKVPDDFFYPFLTGRATCVLPPLTLMVFILVTVMVIL